MFINLYYNQVLILIPMKGTGCIWSLRWNLCVSLSKYWKLTGMCCLFFCPVFKKNTTSSFSAIPWVTPLLPRQEEHHGEPGERAAELAPHRDRFWGRCWRRRWYLGYGCCWQGHSFFPALSPAPKRSLGLAPPVLTWVHSLSWDWSGVC